MSSWYVSKNGNNLDGTNYAKGWTDFNQINWAVVSPGDTIVIDGGTTRCQSNYDFVNHAVNRPGLSNGMMYTAPFVVGKSGTAANPITIKLSTDPGHNGTVVHFGGRVNLLPEANSASYSNGGNVGQGTGIDLRGCSYVIFDGVHRSGFMTYGWGDNKALGVGHSEALRFDETSNHITIRNFEWFDCGTYEVYNRPSDNAPVYKTDGTGCVLGGTNISFDRCLGHDCGQDTNQGSRPGSSITWTNCWFYFRRPHSVWTGYGFNAGCQAIPDQNTTHVDGIQYYAGGLKQGPMTIDYCVFGPGLNQGVYLGDSGIHTTFDSVSITNTLMLGIFRHGIQGDNSGTADNTTPANWVMDHLTIHGPLTPYPNYPDPWLPIEIENGTGHVVTNTIATWGGTLYNLAAFNSGAFSGNIYNGVNSDTSTLALPGGTNVDPGFVSGLAPTNNTPTFSQIMALDLTPTAPAAIGKGSPMHSIQALLDRIDSLNGDLSSRAPTNGRARVTTRTRVTRKTVSRAGV